MPVDATWVKIIANGAEKFLDTEMGERLCHHVGNRTIKSEASYMKDKEKRNSGSSHSSGHSGHHHHDTRSKRSSREGKDGASERRRKQRRPRKDSGAVMDDNEARREKFRQEKRNYKP